MSTANAQGQQVLANQLAYLLPFTEADKIDLLQVDDPQQRLDGIQCCSTSRRANPQLRSVGVAQQLPGQMREHEKPVERSD